MPHCVHLIRTYHPHWGQYSSINQFIRYINPKKFEIDEHIVPMGDDQFPISSKRVRRSLRRLVQRNGVSVYDLNDLAAELIALRQWWRRRINILHYLEGEHSLQYLPLLLRKLRLLKPKPPIVATFHQPPEILDALINMDIVRLLDRVIVMSPDQMPYFEQYLPAHKVSMIPLGIDVDYFQPGTELKEGGKFRCLSVGSWLRDYDPVLAAAEKLQSYPEIEFHIVSKAVTPPAHIESVYVHTDLSDYALLQMYQRADVLLISVTNAVANNAIVEGIACGLPVISTELASIRTYVPGQEAMLIPENNPELFAKAILFLYHNPDLRKEMSLSARRRALALSWQNIVLEYETMYLELVA